MGIVSAGAQAPHRLIGSLKRLGWLLPLAAALSLALMLVGLRIHVGHAVLGETGCPDLPLCYGQVLPAFDSQIALDVAHRFLGVGVSLLIGAAAFTTWRRRSLRRAFGFQVGTAAALLIIQVVTSGLTVARGTSSQVAPQILTGAHMLGSILYLTVILWVSYRVRVAAAGGRRRPLLLSTAPAVTAALRPTQPALTWLRNLLVGATLVAAAQLVLGGFINGFDANASNLGSLVGGSACLDGPACEMRWLALSKAPHLLLALYQDTGLALLLLAGALSVVTQKLPAIAPTAKLTRLTVRALPGLAAVHILCGLASTRLSWPVLAPCLELGTTLVAFAMLLLASVNLWPRGLGQAFHTHLTLPVTGDWRIKDQFI